MSDNTEFRKELEERTKQINEQIESYLPEEKGHQKTIFEAMNYSVKAGGKRLRPLFMQEICRLFTGEVQPVVVPFMAAIEMIHTSSLVHDDLPCMDDDMMRRGQASTWAEYGEDMGVLAGSGASVQQYKDLTIAAMGLNAGDVQAVVCDKQLAENLCTVNDGLKCFEAVYADGSSTQEEYAVAAAKGETDLIAKVNEIIVPLEEDGTIDQYIVEESAKSSALNEEAESSSEAGTEADTEAATEAATEAVTE